MSNALAPAIPAAVPERFANPLQQIRDLFGQPAVRRGLPMALMIALIGAAALAWMSLAGQTQKTLYADLPGVSREKLDLQVEADTLTIEAESDLNVPEGLTSSHTEVGLARFRRVFTLSKELDTERVSAELAQGVLTLRIPKAQHAQPRRIEVQTA